MPIMDVRYAAGSLDKEAKAALAKKLTDVLIQMEGGDYVSPPGKFLVHISIPEGYMNIAHKNEVHAWVAAAITEVAGVSDPGRSILTVIDEVTEGNWGDAGHPISLESIAETVGQSKQGARLNWSRSYFEAKARAMAAAGYPKDVGGLFPSLTPSRPAQADAR